MKKNLFLLSVLLLVSCSGTNVVSSIISSSEGTSTGQPSINIIRPGTSSNEEVSSEDRTSINVVRPSENSSISSEKVSSETVVVSSEKESSTSTFEDTTVANYYKSIDFTKTGTDLMKALEKLLDDTDNTSFTYNGMFDVFKYTDIDPENPTSGKMLSFYSGKPADRSSMNREHTWPDSRGGSKLEKDPHVIRPTLTSENSSRGNSFYNENGSWDPATFNNAKYRGIAARIIFYGAVKAYTEGLYLVDLSNDPQLSSTNSVTGKKWNPTMGKLSTLLKWNLEYEIDETETIRNDVLYEDFNHCRNPFIDNRDLACQIWGDTNADTQKVCNKNL